MVSVITCELHLEDKVAFQGVGKGMASATLRPKSVVHHAQAQGSIVSRTK